jgi:hypothetical protein
MSYFSRFPLLRYTSNNTVTIASDVLKRVAVNQKTKENLVLFDEYDIQEGESPETVSFKFYETVDYHWVVLIVNDILDPRYGWPLKSDELYEYTAAKYGEGNVNAIHHYTISETNDIVVDPTQEIIVKTQSNGNVITSIEFPYADAFAVTNIAHETNVNESKRRIRILKAEYLSAFVTEFERLVNV